MNYVPSAVTQHWPAGASERPMIAESPTSPRARDRIAVAPIHTDTIARPLRIISYGGGVQSTALIVLATRGRIGRVDAAVFANVGDDSEHPATLAYVRGVMIPWATERGFPVHEIHKVRRDGSADTLIGHLHRAKRSIPIPVRMANGAPGRRSCTVDFKIKVIRRWLVDHGATRQHPATKLIGFSTDEYQRATNRSDGIEVPEYPLLSLGLDRAACAQVIRDAGLPVPPKSSCWFCPFHRPQAWAELRRDEPDLFDASCDLEEMLADRREAIGRDRVFFTRFAKPLREAIAEAQTPLFAGDDWLDESGECDSGACFT